MVLVALAASGVIAFLTWWFEPDHIPHNFRGGQHAWDAVLFGALTLVLLHRPFMDALTWVVAWAIRPEGVGPEPQPGLRVAFITTFVPSAEPIELLMRSLPAMLVADYPHDVWVLDEGASPEAQALCAELGVHYFTRHGSTKYNQPDGPFAAKTKGGNHNAWYDCHSGDYDIVAQIDTDFVPRRDFLTKTLGYFQDPRVGWVGTPQVYGNGDVSFVAKGAAQQLLMFYGPFMRGLSGRRSANMIGANHVVRVEALREIGFYAAHLTEDLLTGMQLHAAGWTSRYVATPLAVGEGPTTWQAFFAQQMRWAHGCIDIFFHESPGLFRRMGRRQAAIYGALQQHYFTGVAMALGVALLGAYFFGGMYAANVSIADVALWCLPALFLRQLVSFWLQRFHPDSGDDRGLLLAGRVASVAVWPIYFLASVAVLRGKRLTFKVTPKGAQELRYIPPAIARPHAAIGLFSIACIVAGAALGRTSIPLLAWATLNAITMFGFACFVWCNNARLDWERAMGRLSTRATRVPRHLAAQPSAVHIAVPALSGATPASGDLAADPVPAL